MAHVYPYPGSTPQIRLLIGLRTVEQPEPEQNRTEQNRTDLLYVGPIPWKTYGVQIMQRHTGYPTTGPD